MTNTVFSLTTDIDIAIPLHYLAVSIKGFKHLKLLFLITYFNAIMKRLFISTSIVLLSLTISFPVTGQGFLERVAKRAAEKAEKKAEEKTNEKIDEKIDESFNKAEEALEGNERAESPESNLSKEEKDRQRMSNILGKVGISSEPVNMADNYHFTFMLKMNYQTVKKNGKIDSEGEIVTYATPGEPNFAYEFLSGEPKNNKAPAKGLFLMDFTNNVTLILSEEDGKKTGVAFGMGNLTDKETWKGLGEEDQETLEPGYTHPDVKKTGRTKNILGYKCEEYEYANEEGRANYWITNDLKRSTRDIYSSIFQSAMFTGGLYNGFLMESEFSDFESGEKSTMQVTEVDESINKTFTPGEYEIMNVGSFNIGGGEK